MAISMQYFLHVAMAPIDKVDMQLFSVHIVNVQGIFFNWDPPKSFKCQPVSKFWHLELL